MLKASLLIAGLCLLPAIGSTQTSVGFQNPQDIQTLLDYRLPDWSYRTFDARLALDGREDSARSSGMGSSGASFQGSLGLDYQRTWESEERNLEYGGVWSTDYRNLRQSYDNSETTDSFYQNTVGLNGSYERYLGGGPVSLRGSGSVRHGYSQQHRETVAGEESLEERLYSRNHYLYTRVGAGLGRLRNVRPLLQAQRLNERLQALGRPALSPRQVRRLAEIIATEYGYGMVYDRPERFFWRDVFEPLTQTEDALSPYEIFCLQEALNENLGTRYEGLRLDVGAIWSEDYGNLEEMDRYRHMREITGGVSYYHNPSLTRQYRASLSANYHWRREHSSTDQDGYWRASVGHLWNVTDRLRWDLGLGHNQNRRFEPRYDGSQSSLGSDFHFRLEDRMSLTCGVDLGYIHMKRDEEVRFRWDLVYSVGLSYNLGAGLLN